VVSKVGLDGGFDCLPQLCCVAQAILPDGICNTYFDPFGIMVVAYTLCLFLITQDAYFLGNGSDTVVAISQPFYFWVANW
jgi:hypothetical protein